MDFLNSTQIYSKCDLKPVLCQETRRFKWSPPVLPTTMITYPARVPQSIDLVQLQQVSDFNHISVWGACIHLILYGLEKIQICVPILFFFFSSLKMYAGKRKVHHAPDECMLTFDHNCRCCLQACEMQKVWPLSIKKRLCAALWCYSKKNEKQPADQWVLLHRCQYYYDI